MGVITIPKVFPKKDATVYTETELPPSSGNNSNLSKYTIKLPDKPVSIKIRYFETVVLNKEVRDQFSKNKVVLKKRKINCHNAANKNGIIQIRTGASIKQPIRYPPAPIIFCSNIFLKLKTSRNSAL